MIQIHPIQTGTVSVKKSFSLKRLPGFLSKIAILADPEFVGPLPVLCWLIRHPSGNILVDTGECAGIMDPGHFRKGNPFIGPATRSLFRFVIGAGEEVGPQLERLGTPPAAVEKVIMTHLHLDHIEGLHYFPHAGIYVHEREYREPWLQLPFLLPDWFKPRLFNCTKRGNDIFGEQYSLTDAGDVIAVPTPGHTHGHISVIATDGDISYFFAGDLCGTEEQLLNNEYPGAHIDFREAKRTYEKVKEFALTRKVLFLPTHDPESVRRLTNRLFLRV